MLKILGGGAKKRFCVHTKARRPVRSPLCSLARSHLSQDTVGMGLCHRAGVHIPFTILVFHKVIGHIVAVADERAFRSRLWVQDRAVDNTPDIADGHQKLCLTCQQVCKE